jgi:hypothetical protein
MNNSKQKILYGAGEIGKKAFEYYTQKDSNSVYCFADTFKGGSTYCGKLVLTFEEFAAVQSDYDIVICIYSLFELHKLIDNFKKAGISEFTVYTRSIMLPNIETKFPDCNSQKAKMLVDIANRWDWKGEGGEYYERKNPSMLIPEEIILLHLLGKYYFAGDGHIFDAGICLGGCTEAFASGYAKNPNFDKIGKHIWAYELAKYSQSCPKYIADFMKYNYGEAIDFDGKDFSDLVRKNIAHLDGAEKVKLFIGDITKQEYPDKIEIMFLDVCKSPELNFSMQKLYSRMLPGKSLLIHQDYIYEGLPFMRVTMGYLAEYFEYIGSTPVNSAVWMLKKSIPQEVLDIDPYKSFGFEELLRLHNHWNYVFNEKQKVAIINSIKYIPEFKE